MSAPNSTAATASPKSFLEVDDLSIAELGSVLELAHRVKAEPALLADALAGKQVAVIFEKHSTRTRVSLEVGINSMGGAPIILPASQTQLGRGEPVADTARVLERYVDAIIARVNSHEQLAEMASVARIPVMNALSDLAHPMQALADIQTLQEREAKSVAYVGDGNNVATSLMIASAMTGLDFRIASPPGFEVPEDALERAKSYASESGGSVAQMSDPFEAAAGVDAIYTDVWVSMGDEASLQLKRGALEAYRVSGELMSAASPSAIALHCLPAHRGEEIDAEVIDGPSSAVFDQAENRLHAQKALIAALLGGAK
ncbi:MAG: ornithine carbamoyltransferase [Acidobacteria bacterium]|nr:MAG: ornithine carbamoyltransferase [Acidobacteriota bacterium]